MKPLHPLFPALAMSGPMFMVIGSGATGLFIVFKYLGALMTSAALFMATQARANQDPGGGTGD